MDQEHQGKGQDKIEPAPFRDPSVIACVTDYEGILYDQERDGCKNNHREDRIPDFPLVVFEFGEPVLDFPVSQPVPPKNVIAYKENARDQEIPGAYPFKHLPIIRPAHLHFLSVLVRKQGWQV
jgi:hypothetical protein